MVNFGLSPEDVAYQTAHIHEDRRPALTATLSVLSALSSIAVILRLAIRWRTRVRIGADDILIVIAWILGWGGFVCLYIAMQNGLGTHILAVTNQQFTALLKALIILAIRYQLAVMFTQLSIIFLYKRVFTLRTKWFRNTLYVLGALAVLCEIPVFFAGIFYCKPVKYAWDKTIKGGHCIDVQRVYTTATMLNLVVDVAIVVAPIKLIWSLHMTPSARWGVISIFLLGGFVCIINLIRFPHLINVPTGDVTWANIPVSTWTEAEYHLGVISACLPCFRPIFRSMKGIISTKQSKSSNLTPSVRPNAVDPYKELPGQDTSRSGSKIALVPSDQWTSPPQPAHVRNGGFETIASEGRPQNDMELGLSPKGINVTHEVDVTVSKK
ncbi:hypothetical protein MMC22_004553 [Lobaria immixta]|nr:hypothetical protein [Lobaria immixta]